MKHPTIYRGVEIHYVENDVSPGTLTACRHRADGSGMGMTSQRLFRTDEDWHADIKAKIDAHLAASEPTKGPAELDPLAVLADL